VKIPGNLLLHNALIAAECRAVQAAFDEGNLDLAAVHIRRVVDRALTVESAVLALMSRREQLAIDGRP